MNKTAFMNDLSDKLDRLSEDDRKEYLEFFSKIIDDKIEEDGSNEAAAVEALNSTDNIAEAINKQIPVEPGDAEYVENHSVIDCTNRYRMDDGREATGEVPSPAFVENATPIDAVKSPIKNREYCRMIFICMAPFTAIL